MIPKPVKRLLVEIAGKVGGNRKRKEALANPERCLASLLLTINERATSFSTTLNYTVEYAFFESNLVEAEQFLRRHRSRKVNGKRRNRRVVAATP